jgi:malic enzyme
VHSIKELAKQEVPKKVLEAYKLDSLEFGKNYIIPKPFDPRLIDVVPKAVFDAVKTTK